MVEFSDIIHVERQLAENTANRIEKQNNLIKRAEQTTNQQDRKILETVDNFQKRKKLPK